MKNIIKFLVFVIYSTCIFFLPNNSFILICVEINFLAMIVLRKYLKKIIKKTIRILPYIVFTFAINCLIDDFKNAVWIGIKLIIVCNITLAYSCTTNVTGIADTIKMLCSPLKLFKINTDEIKILVCISLSMIPTIKKDLTEVKDACKNKNIKLNLKNAKYILSKIFISLISRVNQIEEALIAKGYNY